PCPWTDRQGTSRVRTSLGRDRGAQPLLRRTRRGSALLGRARPLRPRRARRGARVNGWQRALVLAPHTDDGEFGCGGAMARLAQEGADVRYVAFSIATRSLPEGFAPDTLPREVPEGTAALGT